MNIRKVAVVGTGTMGRGIAHLCARSGYQTTLRGRTRASVQAGLENIRAVMQGRVQRGRMAAPAMEATLGRLQGVTHLADVVDCDLIIEAIIEDKVRKRELFTALADLCAERTLLSTTTSCLSVTDLAAVSRQPERVVGMHFIDPAYVTKVAEVIRTPWVSEETLQTAREFVISLDVRPLLCKDTPGFVLNRIWFPFVLEAIRALEAGLASKEDIDRGMCLGFQHPWGPLSVADSAGLDIIYLVASAIYEQLQDPKFAPPPLLKSMVEAGQLGRKTGQGFFEYGE
jgi:3-hydroxybutyryl-CoA dehydrogenase